MYNLNLTPKANPFFYAASLCWLLLAPCSKISAQSSNSGAHSPSAFSVDNSIGTIPFLYPERSSTPDGQTAIAEAPAVILSGITNYMKLTGFNFSIPSYAIVSGITVRIHEKATGINVYTAVTDHAVNLVKGGTITGNNAAKLTPWSETGDYHSYGSANNQWGLTLTPADVNSADFGIAISLDIEGVVGMLPTAQIDHVEMSVAYSTVLPIRLASFESVLKTGGVQNTWQLAEEEAGSSIILQRAVQPNYWKDLYEEALAQPRGIGHKYQFLDMAPHDGINCYRLKLVSPNGLVHYSSVNAIRYSTKNFKLHPTVAHTEIAINETRYPVTVFNVAGQLQKVSSYIQGDKLIMKINHLKEGHYFVSAGSHVERFLKQ